MSTIRPQKNMVQIAILNKKKTATLLFQKSSLVVLCLLGTVGTIGCQSPYYRDRIAATGSLFGAGLGAIIGSQTGDAAEGALIGAGIGTLTGAVVGQTMDDEAHYRAQIESQIGRAVQPGPASVHEIVSMSRAGVAPNLIVNYIKSSGPRQAPTSSDLITLHQAGVKQEVVLAMQTPPVQINRSPTRTRPVRFIDSHYGLPVYEHCEGYHCDY